MCICSMRSFTWYLNSLIDIYTCSTTFHPARSVHHTESRSHYGRSRPDNRTTHVHTQFFVQNSCTSDRSLGSVWIHRASINHLPIPISTLFHTNPLCVHILMYLLHDLMSCVAVHFSRCVWPHYISLQHVQLQTWCGVGICAHRLT